ncbi:MAG TPA: MtrB/PioB family decaheme-associated outer membrane protein [Vicinamibacterales bacterium]|nr:MtrB/PioB family decaheme-associated outer membrane protein [Vicinamibacterales bacterium]
MRRLLIVSLGSWLAVAVATAATAQTMTAAAPQTPPPAPAATQPAPATPPEELPGLFEQTWHQFQLGGRFTGVDGDPARFQRYQDLRDGVLFTDFRFAREDSGGASLFRAAADNVGYRDQRYVAQYEKTGRFKLSGFYDGIPQFYSVDTQTPYTTRLSPLLLDDSAQLKAQNGGGQATYVPIATQFDLRERRDIGNVDFRATPTPQLDITAAFTTTRHVGELPWGASFGFSNDVEVALPYDSRTNDFTAGAEWTNTREMLRVSYDGSWFNNPDNPLVWDSPLRLTDASSAPGRGQMSLWPTNSAQTVSIAGFAKFAHRTQLTGLISFGSQSQDQPLLPFTINSALTQIPLPRTSAQASAQIFSTNLNLVSRPKPEWQLSAHVRHYGYDNQTPATTITQYVSYDSSIATSSTGGPELFAHSRTTFDADAIYSGLGPVALTVGYTNNHNGYDFRIFDSANENVLRLAADATGSSNVTFRVQYEYGSRTGSGLDESLLTEIHEQPDMRHYDLADRTRSKFAGQVDFVPSDLWTFSVSGGVGKDNYPNTTFGLQESTFRTFSLGADFQKPDGLGAGGTYNFERYSGLQRSRSASSDPAQFNDPNRDWTADSKETVNYFSIYVTPPRFGPKTEARLSYDFSYAEGNYLYTIVPGGPLTPPQQLPKVYNKLQQLHIDVRHRLTPRMALAFSYLYEPFRVYDFAFDPSVVNGIAQPSSLVLGYVYRPYTANSATISLRYFF